MNEDIDEIRDKMTRDLSKRVFEVMMYGTEIDEDTVFVDYKTMGIRDKDEE